MESIVLFDPSIRSLNLGDHIIMNSAERELAQITRGRFVVKCATHAPAVTFYQNTRKNPRMRFYDDAKYKFVCGSNLLWKRMLIPRPTFNINPFNCMPYEGCILLGVGTDSGKKPLDSYTKRLYRKILSKEFIHSTRDDRTKAIVESIGLKAINTGCPTMWGFTHEFCSTIPTRKASNVIFTITDYSRDIKRDKRLIQILKRNYSKVSMWLQGAFDEEYLNALDEREGITFVSPSLEAFDKALRADDVEYVGTRLHAGMFALQHHVRSVIITVDERVRSMKERYNIACIERNDIEALDDFINSEIMMDMNIDEDAIKQWISQFEKGPDFE